MSEVDQRAPRRREADPGWLQAAYLTLSEAGYRAGGARSAVIDELAAQDGCVTAEELAGRLMAKDRRVSTASVYRALAVLTELGLLHKVSLGEGRTRFELVSAGGEHHHHLVCDRCGRTVTFEDDDLEGAIRKLSERMPYEIDAHEVTLHGTCSACSAGGVSA